MGTEKASQVWKLTRDSVIILGKKIWLFLIIAAVETVNRGLRPADCTGGPQALVLLKYTAARASRMTPAAPANNEALVSPHKQRPSGYSKMSADDHSVYESHSYTAVS